MPQLAWGQSLSPADSIEAAGWLSDSRAALARNQPDSADFFEKKALDIFKKNDALVPWIDSQIERARTMGSPPLNRPRDAVNFVYPPEKIGWRKPESRRIG